MYLLTVAFLMADEQAEEPMPDFESLGLYPAARQATRLGGNFFCMNCGEQLTPADVADALENIDFYDTQNANIYRCHNCCGEPQA